MWGLYRAVQHHVVRLPDVVVAVCGQMVMPDPAHRPRLVVGHLELLVHHWAVQRGLDQLGLSRREHFQLRPPKDAGLAAAPLVAKADSAECQYALQGHSASLAHQLQLMRPSA